MCWKKLVRLYEMLGSLHEICYAVCTKSERNLLYSSEAYNTGGTGKVKLVHGFNARKLMG